MRLEPPVATVAWREANGAGSHVCSLREEADGFELSGAGTASAQSGDEPVEVRFTVRCGAGWATREVEVRTSTGGLHLTVAGDGRWWSGGGEIDSVRGAIDVDLGFTPATNTLPVRRLELGVGDAANLLAAWVRFPDLAVLPLPQRYERLAEDTYRYSSPNFVADLPVDGHGLVLDYPGGWARETATPEPANR